MCDQDIRQGIKNLEAWAANHEAGEFQKHVDMQQAVEELNAVVRSHIDENKPVISFVRDLSGFISFMNRIRKAFLWIAGFAVIAVPMNYLYNHWPFK